MLSNEEREALRNFKSEYETCNHNSSDLIIELGDAKILSNLFKNFIAENKALKDSNVELATTIDCLQTDLKEIKENSIPKSKLKAKIEEVEQWGLYNMKIPKLSTLDERLGAKIGIKYALQSLLGKE